MEELIALADQKNKRVVVYNTDNLGEAVWEWTTDAEGFACVSGIKLRRCDKYGLVMLVCSSEGYAAVVKYPEKNVVWETWAEGNLHSIELLPDLRIAIAASDGNYIRICKSPDDYIQKDLKQAHGVLWDPEMNVLWALGIDGLYAFDVRVDITGIEELTKSFSNTMSWGHDLAPVYGNTDLLWITEHEGVFQYSKKSKEFMSDYNCSSLINSRSVKGIGNTPFTDRVFKIHPNKTYLPWCSDEIVIIDRSNCTEKTYKSNTDAYYKLRIFCDRYQ